MASPATTTLDAAAARDQLPALLRRAASGEEIILSDSGTPLARLVPLPAEEPAPAKPTGEETRAHLKTMRGSITEADDFDPAEPACDPMEGSGGATSRHGSGGARSAGGAAGGRRGRVRESGSAKVSGIMNPAAAGKIPDTLRPDTLRP